MARGQAAGAVRVDIVASNAQFKKAIRESRTRLDRFRIASRNVARSLRNHWKSITVAITASTAAIGAGIKRMASYSAALVEAGRVTGFATKELENLRRLFQGDGLGINQTDRALKDFSVRLGQARRGIGQYARSYKELGIQVIGTNGEIKSNAEVFNQVAAKLGNMQDQSRAASLAYELLGRSGRDLIPIFQKYGEEMDAAATRAGRFNTLTQQMHEQNKELDQKFLDLKENLTDLFFRVLSNVAPRLQFIVDKWNFWLKDLKETPDAFKNISDAIVLTTAVVERTVETFGFLFSVIQRMTQMAAWVGEKFSNFSSQPESRLSAFPGLGREGPHPNFLTAEIHDLNEKQRAEMELLKYYEDDPKYALRAHGITQEIRDAMRATIALREKHIQSLLKQRDAENELAKTNEKRWNDIVNPTETAVTTSPFTSITNGRNRQADQDARMRFLGTNISVLSPRAYRLDPQMAFSDIEDLGLSRAYVGADAHRAINSLLGSGRRDGSPNPNAVMDDLGISRILGSAKDIKAIAIMDDHSLHRFFNGRAPEMSLTPGGAMNDNSPFLMRARNNAPPEMSLTSGFAMDDNSPFRFMQSGAGRNPFLDDERIDSLRRATDSWNLSLKEVGSTFSDRLGDSLSFWSESKEKALAKIRVIRDWKESVEEVADSYETRLAGAQAYWATTSDKAMKKVQENQDKIKKANLELRDSFMQLGTSIFENFSSAGDALKKFARQLLNIGFNRMIMNPLATSLFGAADGSSAGMFGGFFNNMFPAFANGGFASRGMALVGERGPEIVDFAAPGRVYTTEQLSQAMGGGNGITINYNIQSTDGPGVRAALDQATPGIVRAAQVQISDETARYGSTRKMIRGTA